MNAMGGRLSGEAPAKINRELRVGPRRPDGYHEIHSRFVSIDLADRLEVAPADTIELDCSDPSLLRDSNLAVRAARALASRLGIAPAARIHLEKRVPVGAGLGGGSADAALALVLLARLWGRELALDELSQLASELGSDVAYFLVGGEVDVSGRGERLVERPDEHPVDLLLLVPPFSISTHDAYARFDALHPDPPRVPERLEIETSGKFFGPNELASAMLATSQGMAAYSRSARALTEESAVTGSGSCLVLRGATREAEVELRARHPEARIERVRTLTREEHRRRIPGPGGSTWKSRR